MPRLQPGWPACLQRVVILASVGLGQHCCNAERQSFDLSPDPARKDFGLPELSGFLRRKPTRGGRFRRIVKPFRQYEYDWARQSEISPHGFVQFCNRTIQIKSMDTYKNCPADCPYMAELAGDCKFQCVSADKCGTGSTDKLAVIPDKALGYCRRCTVPGCDKCDLHNRDKCHSDGCAAGYAFDFINGTCNMVGGPVYIGIKVALCALVVYLLLWYFDLLALRPVVNQKGVEEGLGLRESTKLKRPAADGAPGTEQYSLLTNLQASANAGIAGAGAILHFNFQMAIIVWSLVLAGGFWAMSTLYDKSLFLMGLNPAHSPAAHCAVIHWGHWVQNNTMWLQVYFLIFAYVFSFVGCIAYSVMQLKRFNWMDDVTSMKDFMLMVRGLPVRRGDDAGVEQEAKEFLERSCGQTVVGVSIAWNFYEKTDEVNTAVANEIRKLEDVRQQEASLADVQGGDGGSGGTPSEEPTSRPQHNIVRRALMKVDDVMFSLVGGAEGPPPDEDKDEVDETQQVKDLLRGMQTSGLAFAVFNTEDERDLALQACGRAGGFTMEGHEGLVTLHEEEVEPSTVAFQHMGIPKYQFGKNIAWGVGVITIAQVLWIVCFYLPTAYYALAFSYANGDEPDFTARLLFSLVVVVGNQIMYQVCAYVASCAGFWFNDSCEANYIVLYTVTCFINIVIDLWITAVLTYRLMVGIGAHMVDGRPLASATSDHDIFEEYMMQRALGFQTWQYNWPSTFLIPFIIEYVFTVVVIRHWMVLLVGSRSDMNTRRSQEALQIFVPMDLGRYADLLLNVVLTTVAFFFATGFFMRTFLALAFSHILVLAYDHYRVLRCVPAFNYSSDLIERVAQAVLGVPCGLILVALVVKSNCVGDTEVVGPMCVRDADLLWRMLAAFTLHMVMYLLVHSCCGALLQKKAMSHQKADEDFATVAASTPSSWFTANPVHCLRSKFVHEHSPPCIFHVRGKEHLMAKNKGINCHFESTG